MKRIPITLLAAAALIPALAGCGSEPTGTVTAKLFRPSACYAQGGPVYTCVPSKWSLLVEPVDGSVRTQKVSEAGFVACQVGNAYPACATGKASS